MDSFHCIKLFTFSLLLSWSCAAVPHRPPSAILAADTLRIRGYSIFASLLVSISSTANFSGTLLAPPDFSFSFASTRILNNHRPPPRPSIPVLLYHTLRPPPATWPAISSRDDGDELRTFYNNNCLHLFKSPRAGQVSISSSPFTNPITTVKIRQPDLYVDENLIVHGIDGVLNPAFATRCSLAHRFPTSDTAPLQLNQMFLGRAMRALRRKGYNVVASAMRVRRSVLLPLTSVTVLAVSDVHLFMTPESFRYNFRHHVIPTRQLLADLARMSAVGVEFYTLFPNKTVHVVSNGGAVTVDGVPVGRREVYRNRWMVVVSVLSSLDDVADSQPAPPPAAADSAPSPPPIPADFINSDFPRAPSPAPISRVSAPFPAPISRVSGNGQSPRYLSPAQFHGVSDNDESPGVPSPAPIHGGRVPSPSPAEYESPVVAPEASDGPTDSDWVGLPSPAAEVEEDGDDAPSTSPSPAPEIEGAEEPVRSPVPSPATDDYNAVNCDLNSVISNGVEGGDLLCPERPERQLLETGGDDVEGYQPFDAEDLPHLYP
ncbi:hypothetical protein SASPL_145695 [Salvia splendens]|uniref:FAS1 domain-containing protein n=1 Tax=Salvia splendens TaxID=180675 RepID=A0A8X8WIY6_SALSN|nr:hypothetical protein SASPL_145695 [Salvia splendens]